MMRTRQILGITLALLAMMLGGCGKDSPVAPDTDLASVSGADWNKSGDPVEILSATLHVRDLVANGQPVEAHRITATWSEAATTWNTFNGSFAPDVEGSFVSAVGWCTVDLTGLVTVWATGSQSNFGVLLTQADDVSQAMYASREYPWDVTYRPYLEIVYRMADQTVVTETLPATADTYISAAAPNSTHGTSGALYTGIVNGAPKQSLLIFDVPLLPPDDPDPGCTLTQGYWKTHSEFGPAPYDTTWAELTDGAATVFFLSGKTYHQVLWTPPAGKAYVILAHQYIAAQLNQLAGADFEAAQDAFTAATTLFETFTPAQVAAFPNAQRRQVLALATTLDDYNNGLIGPGHCDE